MYRDPPPTLGAGDSQGTLLPAVLRSLLGQRPCPAARGSSASQPFLPAGVQARRAHPAGAGPAALKAHLYPRCRGLCATADSVTEPSSPLQ